MIKPDSSGGKHEKAAKAFDIKVMLTFEYVKIDLINLGLFDFDHNGEYSDKEIDKYVEGVNNTMKMNFTDQSSLGPYAGSTTIPQMKKYEAEKLLKKTPAQSKAE